MTGPTGPHRPLGPSPTPGGLASGPASERRHRHGATIVPSDPVRQPTNHNGRLDSKFKETET